MPNNEKIKNCAALGAFMVQTLKEAHETMTEELKALYLALGVENFETIEDSKLYCMAADREYAIEYLQRIIEDLQGVVKDIEKLKI